MKICSKCKKKKSLNEFSFKDKKASKRQSQCKLCLKENNRRHYENNTDLYKERATSFRNRRKKESYEFVWGYLETHPCVDCGETDPVVLEFDHVRGHKIKAISKMIADTHPMQDLANEVKKCEVRCANCHRRKTAQTSGFYQVMKT
ncbi:MAG: hypothetical protein ACXAC5_11880 [Promethearchaeota archaeon]|jgi:hypothetical protein